jgi:hypothetical protein
MTLKNTFSFLLLLAFISCSKQSLEQESWYTIDEIVEVKFEQGQEVKFHSPYRHIFSTGIVSDEAQFNLMGEDLKAGDKLHLKGQSNQKGEIVRLIKVKKVETT